MISLNPPIPPAGVLFITSTFQPEVSAKRAYIRKRSSAKRPASSPPVPARISRKTFFSSFGSFGSSSTFSRSSRALQGLLQMGQLLPGDLLELFVALLQERLILFDAKAGLFVFAEGLDQIAEIGMFLGILLIDPGLADYGRIAQKLLQVPVTGFYILQFGIHMDLV